MADAAALISIVKSALQLFSSIAKEESLLLWNSQKELQRLTDSVDFIASLLRDADKTQPDSEAVQNCLSRLRRAMYDAENLFDWLMYIVLRKRTMSGNAFTKETEARLVDDIPWTSLSSLQQLTLSGMEEREHLLGMHHLTSLTKLTIWNYNKLDVPWTSLTTLQQLTFFQMGERERLPDGIQHLTSLTSLSIYGCKKMTSLPDWIPKLTSLTQLQIVNCTEEMERRCVRERGVDWPLISHLQIATVSSTRDAESRDEDKQDERGSWHKGGCCWNNSLLKRQKHVRQYIMDRRVVV